MKVNIFKILTLSGVLMLSSVSFAQDTTEENKEESSKPKFSGYLDVYSKYDTSGNGVYNSFTSFTKSQGSLELGMASIKAEHNIGKVGAVIDLGFGNRAEEFAYNEWNTNFAIKQAYLTYEIKENLTLTGGTFATHIGYELLDAVDNKNYSMSYAFSYGPFSNTGLKANYTYEEFNFMLGVTLPTDYRTGKKAGSSQKAIIGQAGYTGDERSIFFNFTTQSNNPNLTNTTQFDLVFTQNLTDKLTGGLNATYNLQSTDGWQGHKNWFSGVLYLDYQVKENLTIDYRGELFGDNDAISGIASQVHILSNTISANYKIGELTIIPELRADLASGPKFLDSNKTSLKRLSTYVLLGATYSF